MTSLSDDNKINTSELLKELSNVAGISSDENVISAKIKPYLAEFCDTVETDSYGNLIGFIHNKSNPEAETIIFEAHMDRIGLMVTDICSDGSLKFTNIGGVDHRVLPYAEVTVLSNSNKFTKGIIVPAINSFGENKEKNDNNLKICDLKIETGINEEELKARIKIGDYILINSEYIHLCNDIVSGGAFDNRAGIVSILSSLSNIDTNKIKYNIAILFSVREELGFYGAYWATKSLADNFAFAVVVDVTHGETYDTKGETGVFKLGSGAVICRGPNLHYSYTKKLIDAAKENSVPYEIEVASGSSGTNAWALQTTANGLPVMLISIPLRYMHTNVETLKISDIDNTANLLTIIAEGGLDI